ncbi:hypothetical protein RFI_39455 [Reticulomyxa filosa]|uniref:DH domain-containing protein n=1 Tax=Reticulomyxa filosa TaxID=46433 RepID=X6LAA5_RETFI|nr:hypothetical protein RFI_39455 [Reticulomyxa filosa]|eukprot:ETN98066.1 hypothetical protein RFI_39455 [Reticulomyxa filosa]
MVEREAVYLSKEFGPMIHKKYPLKGMPSGKLVECCYSYCCNYLLYISPLLREGKTEHNNSVEPESRNESSIEKEKILTIEEAIFAFYDSERRHVENLKNGYYHFQHRLAIIAKRSRPILTEKELIGIFGSFQTIGDANQSFLDDLIKLGIKNGIPALRDGIGGEMKKFGHFLKLYSDYIDNVKQGVANLEVAKKKNKNL